MPRWRTQRSLYALWRRMRHWSRAWCRRCRECARPTPPPPCSVSSATPSHPATRLLMSGWLTLLYLCDSVVCRRGSERWCWWTILVGVRRRRCYVTRRRFAGTSGPWCLLRRVFGPWETVTSLQAEFYVRMQSVDIAELSFDCINA